MRIGYPFLLNSLLAESSTGHLKTGIPYLLYNRNPEYCLTFSPQNYYYKNWILKSR